MKRQTSKADKMTVHVFRTKMAMHGNHYAYDGLVPTSELDRSKFSYFEIVDGREYVSFVDATLPAEHHAMATGWERYQKYLDHEKAAKTVLLGLAKQLYPELEPATRWPELWVEIPSLVASHDMRTLVLENAEVSQ